MTTNDSQLNAARLIESNANNQLRNGNYRAALALFSDALRIRKATLGSHDISVADVLISMSHVYTIEKETDMAILMNKQALSIVNGYQICRDHSKVAQLLDRIGTIFFDNKKYDFALNCYKKQLHVQRQCENRDEFLVASAFINAARVYKIKQQFRLAIQLMQQSLLKQQKVLGDSHYRLFETTRELGQLHLENKDYNNAILCFEKAIKSQKNSSCDLRRAEVHELMGMAYLKAGSFHMAVKNFLTSKQMKQALLGQEHVKVALILYKIATAYFMKGDEEHSIFYYKENLEVLKALYGDNHMDVALTLTRMGVAQRQRGHLVEALVSLEDALRIEKNILGENHLSVAKTLNLIGNIHLQKAQVSEAKGAFTKASRILRQCGMSEDHLKIDTFKFYELTILHPEAAAVA